MNLRRHLWGIYNCRICCLCCLCCLCRHRDLCCVRPVLSKYCPRSTLLSRLVPCVQAVVPCVQAVIPYCPGCRTLYPGCHTLYPGCRTLSPVPYYGGLHPRTPSPSTTHDTSTSSPPPPLISFHSIHSRRPRPRPRLRLRLPKHHISSLYGIILYSLFPSSAQLNSALIRLT